MSEADRKTTRRRGEGAFPLHLIDLDAHADGALMRMCAEATNLTDAVATARGRPSLVAVFRDSARRLVFLHEAITATESLSLEGWQMKALYALLEDGTPYPKGGPIHGIAFSVIEDALRLGSVS